MTRFSRLLFPSYCKAGDYRLKKLQGPRNEVSNEHGSQTNSRPTVPYLDGENLRLEEFFCVLDGHMYMQWLILSGCETIGLMLDRIHVGRVGVESQIFSVEPL